MKKSIVLMQVVIVATIIISFCAYYGLLMKYDTLASKYRDLKDKYGRLSLEYANLTNRYISLKTNYTDLRVRYSTLMFNYTELKHKLSNLTKQFLSLVKRYEDLESKYTGVERILKVRALGHSTEEMVEEIIRSIDPSSVEYVIEELGISEKASDTGKVKAVMDWIMLNTMYIPDPFIPVPLTDSISWEENYISLPNETLARDGGDCEDLAILAYTLLQKLFGEGRVWIIAWRSKISSHWGVLVKGKEGWCIVDPAGQYVSGVKEISLRLRMLDTRGREYIVWISPMDVEPDLKAWLISRGFARLEYKGRIGFGTLEGVVRAWLRYWGEEWVYMVASSEGVKFFGSTEDFLEYMRS